MGIDRTVSIMKASQTNPKKQLHASMNLWPMVIDDLQLDEYEQLPIKITAIIPCIGINLDVAAINGTDCHLKAGEPFN